MKNVALDYGKCNQVITIYHSAVVNGVMTFSQQTINGAFFDFRKNEAVNKTGSSEVNSSLIVIPAKNVDGSSQPIFVGDKVVLGQGETVSTRDAWANLIPTKVPNMVVVKYVDPKYFYGTLVHWEAGG